MTEYEKNITEYEKTMRDFLSSDFMENDAITPKDIIAKMMNVLELDDRIAIDNENTGIILPTFRVMNTRLVEIIEALIFIVSIPDNFNERSRYEFIDENQAKENDIIGRESRNLKFYMNNYVYYTNNEHTEAVFDRPITLDMAKVQCILGISKSLCRFLEVDPLYEDVYVIKNWFNTVINVHIIYGTICDLLQKYMYRTRFKKQELDLPSIYHKKVVKTSYTDPNSPLETTYKYVGISPKYLDNILKLINTYYIFELERDIESYNKVYEIVIKIRHTGHDSFILRLLKA